MKEELENQLKELLAELVSRKSIAERMKSYELLETIEEMLKHLEEWEIEKCPNCDDYSSTDNWLNGECKSCNIERDNKKDLIAYLRSEGNSI